MQREEKFSIAKEYVTQRRLVAEKQLKEIRKIVASNEDVVRKLLDRKVIDPFTGRRIDRWSEGTAQMCLDAEFHCEYCDKDFLESVNNYKDIQVDHIEPKSKGGTDSPENRALSCKHCNIHFKSRASISQMMELLNTTND